jgi:hypothetical protein
MSAQPVSDRRSSTLGTAAKAGIGVGVALGAVLVFGLLFWALTMRRKLRKTRDTTDTTVIEGSRQINSDSREAKYKPELDGNVIGPVHEIDGRQT